MDKDKNKKTTLTGRLELKKTFNVGQIKQSFSHGRTKSVSVEVKKKRTLNSPNQLEADYNEKPVFSDPVSKSEETQIEEVQTNDSPKKEIVNKVFENKKPLEKVDNKENKPPKKNSVKDSLESKKILDENSEKARMPKPIKTSKSFENRRKGKLTISQALNDENNEKVRSLAAIKRAREKAKQRNIIKPESKELFDNKEKKKREIIIPDFIAVNELASRLAEKSSTLIKVLMKLGVMATINQTIDGDTAELVVIELGHVSKRISESDVEIGLSGKLDSAEKLKVRPPVVTIMGHVDHGKTSILDAIREKKVVLSEAGGITQHIGSYMVKTKNGQEITFIDTPGHAAFSQMRARGSNLTDIIILVIAADDSVNAQTVEVISHAKASGCPIIVAINKIDLPSANSEKVESDLMKYEIISERMGGETAFVKVSAKTKEGLEELLEAIILQAEVLELKANPNRSSEGTVIESKIEKGKGTVTSVLVQNGCLNVGDVVIAGKEWGKIRAICDDEGKRLKRALPSYPVELLGLSGAPESGDKFVVVASESRAREVTQYRARTKRIEENASLKRVTVDQMIQSASEKEKTVISIVIKADVHGSKEAIEQSLSKMNSDETEIKILHAGVGEINESDVSLATATNAIIFGFNVRANAQAKDLSKRESISIKYFSIIYEVIDEAKKIIEGLAESDLRESLIGVAEIRKVFEMSNSDKVAGCYVESGKVLSKAVVKVIRDGEIIHETQIKSLRREKNEAKEVVVGTECGISLNNFNDFIENDKLEFFVTEANEKK